MPEKLNISNVCNCKPSGQRNMLLWKRFTIFLRDLSCQIHTSGENKMTYFICRFRGRLDHQPLLWKGARAPPRGGKQTKPERAAEIGGNRAYFRSRNENFTEIRSCSLSLLAAWLIAFAPTCARSHANIKIANRVSPIWNLASIVSMVLYHFASPINYLFLEIL